LVPHAWLCDPSRVKALRRFDAWAYNLDRRTDYLVGNLGWRLSHWDIAPMRAWLRFLGWGERLDRRTARRTRRIVPRPVQQKHWEFLQWRSRHVILGAIVVTVTVTVLISILKAAFLAA
jgi:hypothetical protein